MEYDKIGIFAPEQHGDIALCTCVLKYKDIIWPGKKIVWYCSSLPEKSTYLDMLKFNDAIYEIRDWPKFKTMDHFRESIDPNGQLRLNRRNEFESMRDLHNGYFPVPWAMLPNKNLEQVNYANIPKMVFGVDPSWEWHPYLKFSNEEKERAREFCSNLPHTKTIMLETQLKSAGDFRLNEAVLKEIMHACRHKFGKCNFIFASKIDHSSLFDDEGVVSCSPFTVRQTALIYNYCDLFIGVASGITVATSCWGNKPIPKIEVCGITTTYSVIANGPVVSVFADNLSLEEINRKLTHTVEETLSKF